MEIFKYKYDELFDPVLEAFHKLGGSGTNQEVEETVIQLLSLTDEEVDDVHRGNTSKLSYRLAWARNYLKRLGLIENSGRALWALTSEGLKTKKIDKEQSKIIVRKLSGTTNNKNRAKKQELSNLIAKSDELNELTWEDELVDILKNIEPDAFERLSQRFLRELGFSNVEVTGKSADGGIDGKGILKIGGVLSFHVVFQCKRYTGSVSSPAIRDFRGAMMGRADKGLFITTGTFTRDAKKEAQRDGATPIDLIDGNDLAEQLRDLRLGVEVQMKEHVIIKPKWFDSI
ncbi:restriction endonuclease [Pseudoalteromonas sp. 2CM39R]|uniref:restriction endonuclease n=1 Tax=Pseudoalteromonas sp. 2CM39R TaxID=2929856 RepID=UPI0020C139DC|nr:restriction endonuclease [Pseudoalteromonas sp. 2CM39R]MCK8125400.1 restriction endonuclease [Pseudoalteromonas sp. 2CM39R]